VTKILARSSSSKFRPQTEGIIKFSPQIVLISPSTEPPYTYNYSNDDNISKPPFILNKNPVIRTSELATIGRNARSDSQRLGVDSLEDNTQQEDAPRMLIPTSGSSGTPKLIIVTDAMMIRQFTAPTFGVRTVMYSFQPLRQSFDTVIRGGRIGLWSGDLGELHRDMAVLRPTHFGSTPVFWLAQRQLFNAELRNEMSNHRATVPPETASEIRTKLLEKWRDKRLLGNRCKSVFIGGAPSSMELKRWIWDVFGTTVTDGYGTSETGAIATNEEVDDSSNLQLIDVPDIGYLTSDTPYPRGEIIAFTQRLTPGYYNDPVANEKAFIKIGVRKYFRTGDIGMLIDGKLTVIDRKNALFKLPNGVFVAPAPLETIFSQSPLIKQALVHGVPEARTITVVVVLTDAGVQECEYKADEKDDVELRTRPILKECARIAIEADRKEYEIPHHAILSTEEWTVENGCLTSNLKPCRPVLLKKFFADSHILSLNKRTERERGNEENMTTELLTENLQNTEGNFGVSAGLEQVLRETIPSLASPDAALPSEDQTLHSLGVDSLALAVLRSSLQSRFGVNIPLTQLAGTTLLDLNTAVLGGGVVSLPDMEDDPESLQEEAYAIREEWRLTSPDVSETHLGTPSSIEKNKFNEFSEADSKYSNIVFLTGVTGYVGAFMLNELLKTASDTHVVCLVRAENQEYAIKRVENTLQQYTLQCNPQRWSVMAGNLAEERLGLSEKEWSNLVSSICIVYHAGAIVNASLPLEAIRPTNITGTKNIVELCVAAKADLHFISTASVLSGSGMTNERFNIPPPGKFSTAYAKSKWVAEQIVGYGASELGLQAIIYRLGTMACHSETGACNPNDTFTRILKGVMSLEVYTDDKDSPLPKGFYLAPIDWAVHAVCTIAEKTPKELKDSCSTGQKEKVEKKEEKKVDVFHILTSKFTPMTTAFNAIAKYGIPLSNLSSIEFKAKLNSMAETNAMYTFRDIFKTSTVEKNPLNQLSTTKTLKFTHQCPEVGESVLLKMIKFLHPQSET
jgi:fatty acid CoA ligase FadD9